MKRFLIVPSLVLAVLLALCILNAAALNRRTNRWMDQADRIAQLAAQQRWDQAREAMTELCQYVDVCIGNESDAADVFGVKLNNSQIVKGKLDMDEYRKLAETLMDRFPFRKVAMTLRESISASDNDWSAMIYDGEQCYFSTKYHLHMVDRVGGGDAFAGGLIHSLAEGRSPKYALEFAVAASALKHSINGDFNLVTPAEVETLMNGDGSGRVQR